jgi:hypothetical protein
MIPQHAPLSADIGSKVLRRVVLTVVAGGTTYLMTNLADQPQMWAITLSAFISGVTLVLQFLIDFERRLASVETALSKVSEAAELFHSVEASALGAEVLKRFVRDSTQLDGTASQLVLSLAQEEVTRTSEFLKELSEGREVSYEGEDQVWLLTLARNARYTIDATSLTTVDGAGNGTDGGFWFSDLGQRYIKMQSSAIKRGVTIRRVFVVDCSKLNKQPEVWGRQRDIGIKVRVLDLASVAALPRATVDLILHDFIIFDDHISYEVALVPLVGIDGSRIMSTRLVLRPARVKERIECFNEIWAFAEELL